MGESVCEDDFRWNFGGAHRLVVVDLDAQFGARKTKIPIGLHPRQSTFAKEIFRKFPPALDTAPSRNHHEFVRHQARETPSIPRGSAQSRFFLSFKGQPESQLPFLISQHEFSISSRLNHGHIPGCRTLLPLFVSGTDPAILSFAKQDLPVEAYRSVPCPAKLG
jgi:hypothetical protein